MNKSIICLIVIIALSFAHPTKYQVDRNETCYKPTSAPIKSWHIHILYWQNSDVNTKGAFAVRDQFINDFKNVLGAPCTDLFHQDHLCMFDPDTEPAGPFLTAQWSVFVPLENFSQVVQWSIQNRNGYDLLIHPNSGCEVEDHTWWAMWSGNAWQLDTSIFSHDQPFPWPEDKESLKAHQQKAEEESPLIRLFNKHHNNNN